VLEVDEKGQQAKVDLGELEGFLVFEGVKWARRTYESNGQRNLGSPPVKISDVVQRGDVIWVSLLGRESNRLKFQLEQQPEIQGALFSIEVETGFVLALEGGYDFKKSEFNRATQAKRQQGSSFKPIIYSAALEKGYTPASIIVDAPIVYSTESFGKWKPANFEEKFYGDTTFRQALIHSRNVPTIKIVEDIQVSYVIEYARRLGMTAEFNPDLSISLGSGASTLVELTDTYAIFPRFGRKVEPIFYTWVKDRNGQVLEEFKPKAWQAPKLSTQEKEVSPSSVAGSPGNERKPKIPLLSFPQSNDPEQVMDPRVAYVMAHLMKEVVSFGTGHGAKELGRPAAGKTGTTNDYLDAWFTGFTPYVATGAWVGYDGQKSIGAGETGAKAALPIWVSFMKEAVKPYPPSDFVVPDGVIFAQIDPSTGKLAATRASNSIREAFIEGTEPVEVATPKGAKAESQSDFFKEDID
jgi:penicillin-binding protein 1A